MQLSTFSQFPDQKQIVDKKDDSHVLLYFQKCAEDPASLSIKHMS